MTHTTTLIQKREIATGTMEFTFARPSGFSYVAGQTIDVTLIDPPETDEEGNSRTFSLVSAPHEPSLKIATRMRDTTFKRVLGQMNPGTPLSIEGPFGSFSLHENVTRPAVFLAGGIGITPFRSMIVDAVEQKLEHTIILFFSNRRSGDAAFLGELESLAHMHPNIIVVPTVTEAQEDEWQGERGYIDAAMLDRYIPKGSMPIYYLAGPQAMVSAMRTLLVEKGVSGDDIRFEEFAGY